MKKKERERKKKLDSGCVVKFPIVIEPLSGHLEVRRVKSQKNETSLNVCNEYWVNIARIQ